MNDETPVAEGDTRTRRVWPADRTVQIRVRTDDGLAVQDLYREDVLIIGGVRYLVLNLGHVQRSTTRIGEGLAAVNVWVKTTLLAIELQAVSETGEGLAQPVIIECQAVTVEPIAPEGATARTTLMFDESVPNARLDPVSPRRAADWKPE